MERLMCKVKERWHCAIPSQREGGGRALLNMHGRKITPSRHFTIIRTLPQGGS
jgi:hypothetical protein